jgi:two-component system NarL family sensor kinase
LRVLLLPILLAGYLRVAHPEVGTGAFDVIFLFACVYAALALIESRRRRLHAPLWLYGLLDLAFVCALTYVSGRAFSQLHWAFVFLPLGAAILLDPLRAARVAAVAAIAYLAVAFVHPTTRARDVDLIVIQGLYIAWAGVAAAVFAGLLARRQARIVRLASERGDLVAQALAAEDRTRRRIADELHDSAIQNLLAARQDLAEARGGSEAAIARAEAAVRQTLEQLRATIRELHPYVLEQLGLEAALETIADQQTKQAGYRVRTRVDPGAVGVHDALVFSLARELLANVTRHAGATRATLELTGSSRGITLTVADDGDGIDERQLARALGRGHIGLASCRERVRAVQGRLEISTAAGRGTSVRCFMPVPAPTADGKSQAQLPDASGDLVLAG